MENAIGFAGGGGSSSSDYSGGSSSGSSYSGSSYGGGYSSSSSGGSMRPEVLLFGVVAYLVIGIIVFVYTISKHNKKKDSNNTVSDPNEIPSVSLSQLLSTIDHNTTPQEKWIHEEAQKIFLAYQDDWSKMNTEGIKEYTTPEYGTHATLMLEVLKSLGRRNTVDNLNLVKVTLPSSVSDKDTLPIKVTVCFKFSGKDRLIDEETGLDLFRDNYYGICELWGFIYDGETLKLDEISQPTESNSHLKRSLEDFAINNQLYYSPDWGRYALPTDGVIFDGAVFERSDVNNHIVGKWDDTLFQMYTYSKSPAEPNSYYLVGQLTVPKRYYRIIIKSQKPHNADIKIPQGYEEIKTEWEEFNEEYQIFASKKESVTAFELVDPSFMANLYDRELDYNIEVVDHTIYIFAKITETRKEEYDDLLDILKLAYQRLEM